MYIDTHFHLSQEDYDDCAEVLRRARQEGVSPFIMSACSRKSIEESLLLASKEKDVFVTIGYHPEEVENVTEADYLFLEESLQHPKVVGIGEIGLDYHYSRELIQEQKELFLYQLQLAERHHLPVVIHTRDAIQDTYDILKDYSGKVVLHCFSESKEMAKLFSSLHFYFGIGGVVTFKNSRLPEVIGELPLSSLVLETDSPYLAPDPYRGSQNGPWNIPIIAEKLASIYQVPVEVVASTTSQTAREIFDLPPKL